MTTTLLPKPLELAKIAAAIGPHDNHDKAIGNAIALYRKAVAFCNEHRNDSALDLAIATGNDDLIEEQGDALDNERRLCLDPKTRTDPARSFLKANGKTMKRTDTVLENLQELLSKRAERQGIASPKAEAKEIIQLCKRTAGDGHEYYMIPKSFLQSLVDWKRWKKQQGGKKSLVTAAKRKVSKTS